MRELPKIICIVGPDGTGKTTQIRLLKEHLQKRGFTYKYMWLRFNHFFSVPILLLGRALKLTEIQKLPNDRKIGYHHYYKSKLISTLFTFTTLLDTYLGYLVKVIIPYKIFKRRFICDRYVQDVFVDLMLDTKKYDLPRSFVGKLLLKLIPKESMCILLIAKDEEIKERRIDVKFDKWISRKVALYLKLYKLGSINRKIISNKDIDVVHKLVIKAIYEGEQ